MNERRKALWMFSAILVIIGAILITGLYPFSLMRNDDRSVDFEVTGYSYDPPAYKRSAHRYLFLKNDLGSFTIEVSPQTYYNAEHGQKNMTFTFNTNELMNYANNDLTKDNVINKYCEIHKVSDYAPTNKVLETIFVFSSFVWFIGYLFLYICIINFNEGEIEKLKLRPYEHLVLPIIGITMIWTWFEVVVL